LAKNKKAIKARFLGEAGETMISRALLYRWKSQDKKFSDEWDRITGESRQEVKESLISALIRAGLEGNVGAIALYFKLVEGWTEKEKIIPAKGEQENPLRFYHSLGPEERRAHIKTLRDKLTGMLDQMGVRS
jgi:hypothetical protein